MPASHQTAQSKAQGKAKARQRQKEQRMSTRATGTFDVTTKAAPPYDTTGGVTLGRVTIDKQFQGDLVGSSAGEMLSAVTSVPGSAGYVAIERVAATLHGRAGGFVLQHGGTMTRGKPGLSVTVVPDSGTGDLTGLAGEMKIDIVDGKHLYTFDYTLDAA
jgi:hypothetical protein